MSSWRTRPDVGFDNPAIRLRIVDLPLPEGPRRQTNSPAATLRDAPRRISTTLSCTATLRDTSSSATLAPVLAAGRWSAGASVGTTRASPQPFANANTVDSIMDETPAVKPRQGLLRDGR